VCPKCASSCITVRPFDFGRCADTGYHDAGEDAICRDCGYHGDVEEFEAAEPIRKPVVAIKYEPMARAIGNEVNPF